MDTNEFLITGQICKTPKFITTKTGLDILNLVILNKRSYVDQKGQVIKTSHEIPVSAFGLVANYFKKNQGATGDDVYITGHLGGKEYKGKHYPQIIASRIYILCWHTESPLVETKEEDDEDLPF